ncbi:uncharacterized protein [Centroberyx affinis]|uniref:uncharacterized protein n=1 Tax=Centroberyx affinis TaxID=166261 RepID=UPI003A5BAC4A
MPPKETDTPIHQGSTKPIRNTAETPTMPQTNTTTPNDCSTPQTPHPSRNPPCSAATAPQTPGTPATMSPGHPAKPRPTPPAGPATGANGPQGIPHGPHDQAAPTKARQDPDRPTAPASPAEKAPVSTTRQPIIAPRDESHPKRDTAKKVKTPTQRRTPQHEIPSLPATPRMEAAPIPQNNNRPPSQERRAPPPTDRPAKPPDPNPIEPCGGQPKRTARERTPHKPIAPMVSAAGSARRNPSRESRKPDSQNTQGQQRCHRHRQRTPDEQRVRRTEQPPEDRGSSPQHRHCPGCTPRPVQCHPSEQKHQPPPGNTKTPQ